MRFTIASDIDDMARNFDAIYHAVVIDPLPTPNRPVVKRPCARRGVAKTKAALSRVHFAGFLEAEFPPVVGTYIQTVIGRHEHIDAVALYPDHRPAVMRGVVVARPLKDQLAVVAQGGDAILG